MRASHFFLLTLTSVALFVGVNSLSAAPVSAKVYFVSGRVEYWPPQGKSFIRAKAGQFLPAGSIIQTGDDGTAVLVTTPGSAAKMDQNSTLTLASLAFARENDQVTERKVVLQLSCGEIHVLVDSSTPKITDFRVETPEGIAPAHGPCYKVWLKEGRMYSVGEDVATFSGH